MNARHLVVEVAEPEWSGGKLELNFLIKPKETGTFRIYIRGWICANGYEDCNWEPSSSSTTDQQGHNVLVEEVTVKELLPDLVVSDLTVGDDPSRSVFTVGERVNIHAVVKNTGDASAGSKSTLEYSISGRPIKDVRISNLSRGKDEATSIPYTFKDEDVGRRTITARADADSDVKEKSGGNNERSVTFTVEKRKYPDLDVAKPTVNGTLLLPDSPLARRSPSRR